MNRRELRTKALRHFFRAHGFRGIHSPAKRGYFQSCLPWMEQEVLYPLHAAVKKENLQIIQTLLRLGADPEQTTSWGRTAVEMASGEASEKHQEMVEVLEGRKLK